MKWWIAFKCMLDPPSVRDGIYYAAAHRNVKMLESYALFLNENQRFKLDKADYDWIVTCNHHAKTELGQYSFSK